MQVADHILLPLLDGRRALAQVLAVQGARAAIYMTDQTTREHASTMPVKPANVVAVLAVDIATLTATQWPIAGYEAIPSVRTSTPDLGSDDTPLHDPAIVEAFANALHGLYPWDGFPDPDFFTKLLRDPARLPATARKASDISAP